MKKILFSIGLLLIVISSCKKRVVSEKYGYYPETVVSLPEDPVASTRVDYMGIQFEKSESWIVDTTKVDEGVYKILVKPSYSFDDQDKIVINIHDAVLNTNNYMDMLKTQITNSSKTKDALFTDVRLSSFNNGSVMECTFSGDYPTGYGSYDGLIRIYQDKKANKTYSLLYLLDKRNIEDYGDDLDLFVKSIQVRNIRKNNE